MPKVSVIIPVYNREKYLRRCIDSVLHQTLKDIEIILVDDGSTDSSPAICDEYERTYNNVRVIHQENRGASSARNTGLDNAEGEYVGFVDSDDYIAPEMYENLYCAAKNFCCDIAMCNYQTVKENRTLSVGKIAFPMNVRVDNDEVLRLMETANAAGFLWFNCNKLFNCKAIQKHHIRFNTELKYGEDTPFNMETMINSSAVVFLDEPLYFYEQTDNSQIRAKHKHNYLEKLENLYDEKMNILHKYSIGGGGADLYKYTMLHTLPLLLCNELHYKRQFSDKIDVYRKMRNSRMIDDAMKNVNCSLIRSKLKYLALLLKYRCYVLLTLITN